MDSDPASSILNFVGQRRQQKAIHSRLQSRDEQRTIDSTDNIQSLLSSFADPQAQTAAASRLAKSDHRTWDHTPRQVSNSIFDTDAESIDESRTVGDNTNSNIRSTHASEPRVIDHALPVGSPNPSSTDQSEFISSNLVAGQHGQVFTNSKPTAGILDDPSLPLKPGPKEFQGTTLTHAHPQGFNNKLRNPSTIPTNSSYRSTQTLMKKMNSRSIERPERMSGYPSMSFHHQKRASPGSIARTNSRDEVSQQSSDGPTIAQHWLRKERSDLSSPNIKISSTSDDHGGSGSALEQMHRFNAASSPEGSDDENYDAHLEIQRRQYHSQKRARSLDFPMSVLKHMEYQSLKDQPFDHIPNSQNHNLPGELSSGASEASIIHLFHSKDQKKAADQRTTYFNSLSIEDHEYCGDIIIENFRKLTEKLKHLRREKRAVCREYEESIGGRQALVSRKRAALEVDLKAMQSRSKCIISRSYEDPAS